MIKRMTVHQHRRRISWITGVAVLALGGSLATSAAAGASSATAVVSATPGNQAAHIAAIVQKAMKADHLNAAIFRVTVDGKPVVTGAFGTSMTGVPATTAMHFRNGSVAYSYLTTLLMKFVDEHKISLNDKIAQWLPKLPEANQVTVKMLANMTSGYPDYVTDPKFIAEFYQNPFHQFTMPELLAIAFSRPVSFPPGTNWGYAHTNMVILGQILQMAGGKPLATLLYQNVLGPLGLTNTVASSTAAIPDPVLHAFSSERRDALGIPPATPFYEESTYWNPAWTTPAGAAETTNIYDMTKTAEGIGSGALLSKSSYQAQTGPNLLGFGHAQSGCACVKQTNSYNFGLGIVRTGSWLVETPSFGGYAATEAYLPSEKIAIAVANTFAPQAFDAHGNSTNSSEAIFRTIGAYLAPNDPPPGATS
ncbi:MAG: serine hydrolase domain-containing protein [Streptosporangiaceae bacterium]